MSEQVIWKFVVAMSPPASEELTVEIPAGAQDLHFAEQGDRLCLWALVYPNSPPTPRRFRIHGTGHPFDPAGQEYIGTAQAEYPTGQFVWHLFEVLV